MTHPKMTRRTALKGMVLTAANAAVVSQLVAAEAGSVEKTGLGLVTYCCGLRRKWMRQQHAEFDLFEPLMFLKHCLSLGAGGMQANLGVMKPDEVRKLREYAERHNLFIDAIISPPKSEADTTRFEAEVQTAAEVGVQAARTVIMDVYLEKPLTVTIREGRLLADMVKKTSRVLQVGSQQRTMEINRFACEFIRDGGLGKVTKVELPNYPGPLAMGDLPSEPIPDGLDWNLFLGTRSLRPHSRKLWMKEDFKVGDLLWRGWDLYRDYSGHLMTNWGAHSVDMVQYALGKDDTGPVEIRAEAPEAVQPIWEMWKQKTPAPVARRFEPSSRTPDSENQATGELRRFWPVTMR